MCFLFFSVAWMLVGGWRKYIFFYFGSFSFKRILCSSGVFVSLEVMTIFAHLCIVVSTYRLSEQ